MDNDFHVLKLERDILEIERKIRAIDFALNEIERDLAKLDLLESTLIENLFWLKHSKIIVAGDYKKAKSNLIDLHNRRAFLATDHKNNLKEKIKLQNTLEYRKDAYYYYANRRQNNVIFVDFIEKTYDK